MKSIKTMLLGIAVLIIAACGATIWMAGAGIGAVVFFSCLVIGLFLVIDGFLTPHQ